MVPGGILAALLPAFLPPSGRLSQANASGRDSKGPGARSGQNLPAGGPGGPPNSRSLSSGRVPGKPWK